MSRKGRTAWFTAAIFAVGTIVVPTLHLTFHALPHDHRAAEIHYHDHAEVAEHSHGSGGHRHEEEPLDPHHGKGSAAHFSLALSDSAASTVVILPLLGLAASPLAPPRSLSPVVFDHVFVERFRGPPRG